MDQTIVLDIQRLLKISYFCEKHQVYQNYGIAYRVGGGGDGQAADLGAPGPVDGPRRGQPVQEVHHPEHGLLRHSN